MSNPSIRPFWIFFLFASGWIANKSIFRRYDVDYASVVYDHTSLAFRPDGARKPWYLWGAICWCVLLLVVEMTSILDGRIAFPVQLLCFLFAFVLFLSMDGPSYNARLQIREAIVRCIFPPSGETTPFLDILLADGLTSVSKPLYDIGIGLCQLQTSEPVECKESVFPYILMALPFFIRARQTWISAWASNGTRRYGNLANFGKYCSAFPVILVASRLTASSAYQLQATERLWVLACVFNMMYSLFWDIVMDWGLFQEGLRGGIGRQILFPRAWYSRALVFDICGRLMWAMRYSPLVGFNTVSFVTVSEVTEVCRRLMWNLFRIEWEIVKTEPPKIKFRKSDPDLSDEATIIGDDEHLMEQSAL